MILDAASTDDAGVNGKDVCTGIYDYVVDEASGYAEAGGYAGGIDVPASLRYGPISSHMFSSLIFLPSPFKVPFDNS